jgi:two-component system, OmpR family, response regulator
VFIDDEEDPCHFMRKFLFDLDYDFFLANTLRKGMSLMKEVIPDILFIDNNLPDGLGWEKMNYLVEEYPDCKINLISAYKSSPPEANRKPSSVKVIEKPLSLNALKNYL